MKVSKVFIIHGWGGYPEEGWFPWLKTELEKRGISVVLPSMPDSENPRIESWVNFLEKLVGVPDLGAFFVGHSIGCQAILRYLEKLTPEQKVGGAVLVAPWMALDQATIAEEGGESVAIARPWMETPIDFNKVKTRAERFTAIFSDDDSFVPVSQKELFADKLEAKIIVENNKGHFSGSDGILELPSALNEILKNEV